MNKIYNEPCLDTLAKMEPESNNGRFQKGQHWRKPKPHWNKEWMYEKYITQKMTLSELAAFCGCTDSNISYWITKHGISWRPVSETRAFKYWGSSGSANGMYGKTGTESSNWKGGLTPERQRIYSARQSQIITMFTMFTMFTTYLKRSIYERRKRENDTRAKR